MVVPAPLVTCALPLVGCRPPRRIGLDRFLRVNTRLPLDNSAPSAPGRRRAAIAISLLLAALLNAGAIGMASQRARPAGSVSQAAARATLVLLPPAPARPAAARPQQLAMAPQAVQPTRPAEPVEAPQAVPPSTVSPDESTALGVPPVSDTLTQPVRFYTFHEVDRAAEPDTDWPLDIETLDAIGIARLVFEVMVDDRGSVIACSVLDPSGLPEAARLELEQRLAATPLRPALRGGRFVASQRRIELLVEPNT
jgi:hypothetical protein